MLTVHGLIMNENIDLVQQYQYLSLLLDDYLKFEPCDNMLAKSGVRALASLINKHNVSGYNKFNKCDQIQYRAIRFFLSDIG